MPSFRQPSSPLQVWRIPTLSPIAERYRGMGRQWKLENDAVFNLNYSVLLYLTEALSIIDAGLDGYGRDPILSIMPRWFGRLPAPQHGRKRPSYQEDPTQRMQATCIIEACGCMILIIWSLWNADGMAGTEKETWRGFAKNTHQLNLLFFYSNPCIMAW